MAHFGGAADPLIGRTVDDRYRVEDRIGGGGMGAVYRARHLLLNQRVALKVLHPDLAADPSASRRFLREARSTFRFDHPHCVRVTDLGATGDGLLYLVMEHLAGETLAGALGRQGALAPDRAAAIGAQIADALTCAHALGFAHRDLKPENVMLLPQGGGDHVKVLDFGLAKIVDADLAAGGTAFSLAPLTQEGRVFGTPEYMSPEQARGFPLDTRTDLYSLGVLLYQMVVGQPPFCGRQVMEILKQHVSDAPPAPSSLAPVPPALEAIILRCLGKAPAERPASARDLAGALREIAPGLAAARPRVAPRLASSPTEDLAPAAGAPAAEIPAPAGDGATAFLARHRRSRAVFGAALAVAAIAVAAFVAGVTGDRDDGERGAAPVPDAAPPVDTAAAAAADGGVGFAPGAIVPSAASSNAGSNAEADGAPTPPARRRARERSRPTSATATDTGGPVRQPSPPPQIARHLRAAEAARKAGNALRQLAEADRALSIDPDRKRAAFLVGDALLASGDDRNGCRYLERAFPRPRARARHERAGCSHAPAD